MTLGEAVIAEPFDLLEAALGEVAGIFLRNHAFDEFFLEGADGAGSPERRHRPPQLIRLGGREPGRDDGDAHGLLLEQGDAIGLLEHLIQLRTGNFGFLQLVAPAQIGVHHVALDRAGPDDRDLHHQIIEFTRLETRQHAHLRAAFHLEDTHGIRLAQHIVDFRLFRRDGGESQLLSAMPLDQLKSLADAGQHAERKHIDLQHAQCIEVVLVPLDDRAVLHRRILDRHIFVEAAAGDDEAADMLRQVAREADQLLRQSDDLGKPGLFRIEAGLADMLLDDIVVTPAPDSL